MEIGLIPSAPEGRAGCLTDGKRWDFVYLKPARVQIIGWDLGESVDGYEVYETNNLGGTKKEEIKQIMGIILRTKLLIPRHTCSFRLKIFAR